MRRLDIDLGHTRYAIHIGAGLFTPQTLGSTVERQCLVVTNDTVAPLYLDAALAALPPDTRHVVLPDGESYKTLATLDPIFETLLRAGFDRGCTLLALGGGVVGDITGFAAASYQRGVACVQMPTTLLAQVDSSVGGKTGVNHPLGKNMIGAFHQPRAVLIDVETLDTLPERELSAGLAEVIKHGLILDADYFDWIEASLDALLARDQATLVEAIERSCAIKAAVVREDEREQGRRALLNLGHTFGHAIESALGYGRWLHGEAVAAGLVMALSLSARLGRIPPIDAERTARLLERARLPIAPPDTLDADTLLDYMYRDKKVSHGSMRLVLLDRIGCASIVDDVPRDSLHAHVESCLAATRSSGA